MSHFHSAADFEAVVFVYVNPFELILHGVGDGEGAKVTDFFDIVDGDGVGFAEGAFDGFLFEVPEMNFVVSGGDPLIEEGQEIDFVAYNFFDEFFCGELVFIVPEGESGMCDDASYSLLLFAEVHIQDGCISIVHFEALGSDVSDCAKL